MANISKKELLSKVERLEGSLSFILNLLDQHHFNIKAIVQMLDKAGMIPEHQRPKDQTVEEATEEKTDIEAAEELAEKLTEFHGE